MSGRSHEELLQLASLYALRALPSAEAAEFEAHLATCPECRAEVAGLTPAVGSFASWPVDVLRPAGSLWNRVSDRIATEPGVEPLRTPPEPPAKPEWQDVAAGIAVKLLSLDNDRQLVTMLVRLAPGADYPPHRHADIEELHLLDGELWVDDRKLVPGDFIEASAGSEDHRVWSETGCTCVLLTSLSDNLLS